MSAPSELAEHQACIKCALQVLLWDNLAPQQACAAVGIISGIYPAIRAARLDPVQAFRFE